MKYLDIGDLMITFLGDIAPIEDGLRSDYKPSFPYFFNFEYVCGNRENLVPVENKINLCSNVEDFKKIFGTDPIAVSIANNHIGDFGEFGIQETISHINKKNILIAGIEPCWISERVCILAYMALGTNSPFEFDYQKVKAAIINSKKRNPDARIIVQMHWGVENNPSYISKQSEIGHWLIDNGVDLVIGHHPHCIQPVEQYKGKYIFYSLGNGLFGIISQPSHYNSMGKPTRNYRFKWRSWNRKSMAVLYDEVQNKVISVDLLYQKGKTLKVIKKDIPVDNFLLRQKVMFSNLIYKYRKYSLFLTSNLFVDGKIFDVNALMCELRGKK